MYLGRCPRLVCVAPLGLGAGHGSWEVMVLRRAVEWRSLPSSLRYAVTSTLRRSLRRGGSAGTGGDVVERECVESVGGVDGVVLGCAGDDHGFDSGALGDEGESVRA